MTTPLVSQILSAFDAGDTPAAISRDLDTSLSRVYQVLRAERPARPRAPRLKGGSKTTLVAGLLSLGYPSARVAELARCSRQYVYRVQANGE